MFFLCGVVWGYFKGSFDGSCKGSFKGSFERGSFKALRVPLRDQRTHELGFWAFGVG